METEVTTHQDFMFRGPGRGLSWHTADPAQISQLVSGCACPSNVPRSSSLANLTCFPGVWSLGFLQELSQGLRVTYQLALVKWQLQLRSFPTLSHLIPTQPLRKVAWSSVYGAGH